MSRMRRGQQELAPSLFPFLAVLVCTMGALVLILMLIVGQAQATAREISSVKQVEEISEEMQAVSAELEAVRERQQAELERQRTELAHVEDHIARSMKKLEELNAAARALLEQKEEASVDTEELALQREQLAAEIEETKSELEKKIEEQKDKKLAFSIIPYQGPNGTNRRPIYIECTADGVIIQPEGFVLGPRDLRPPHGPGNPLDSVLRTIRSHMTRDGNVEGGTPYPLLIVRPSGIRAYALARGAMSSWDDQFGYELVAEDMPLEFPPAVESLKGELQQTIALARERQSALIAAMPVRMQQFADDEEAWVDDDRELPEEFEESGEFREVAMAEGSEGVAGSGANGMGGSGDSRGFSGNGTIVGSGAGGNGASGGDSMGLSLNGSSGAGFAGDQGQTGFTGAFAGGSPGGQLSGGQLSGGQSSGGQSSGGQSSGGQSSGQNGSGDAGYANSQATGEYAEGIGESAAGETGYGSGGGNQSGSSQSGSTSSGGNAQSGRRSSSNNASSGAEPPPDSIYSEMQQSGGGGGMAGVSGGEPSPSLNFSKEDKSPQTYSQRQADRQRAAEEAKKQSRRGGGDTPNNGQGIVVSRGMDWTSQNMKGTAVERSIRIVLYEDRWVVLPEQAKQATKTVFLKRGLGQARADLMKAISGRVDSWGMALAGGHWKPRLLVTSTPETARQLEDLQRALKGSGIDVVVDSPNANSNNTNSNNAPATRTTLPSPPHPGLTR